MRQPPHHQLKPVTGLVFVSGRGGELSEAEIEILNCRGLKLLYKKSLQVTKSG